MNRSRLHAEIMNIGTTGDILGRIESAAIGTDHKKNWDVISNALDFDEELEGFNQLLQLAYKLGHRDARHAAAELALKP